MSNHPDIIPEGLPYHLPEGERLLWQGRPDWKRMAIDAFHVRKVAVYFVVVTALRVAYRLANGEALTSAVSNVPFLVGCGVVACAILTAIAYASARTTRYTLTSKRALMKVGIALPLNVNIPYSKVDGVSFAETGGGCGTICFKPGGDVRLAYLMLWPHAKPWQFSKPQPSFRCIADVETVASQLAMIIGGRMPVQQVTDDVVPGHMVPAE